MPGFRKESFYIKKYGEEVGRKKYQDLVTARLSRTTRRISNDTVECQLCHKNLKRITKTHLLNSCVESITTEEYQFRFPGSLLIANDLKKLYSNTKESIVEKYGEEIGSKKWKDYCNAQAVTNTLEYKIEKYGISDSEFAAYNKLRAATLENFIRRYGETLGLQKWENYCERQRYTTSIEYFIEKYGNDEGIQKYKNFCVGRSLSNKVQSKVELDAYEELKHHIENLELSIKLTNEFYGPYDYGNLDQKKLIEFYGTYWHADPRFFEKDHTLKQKQQSAEMIWSRDQAKRSYATNLGFKIFVIWEHDWRKNKQQLKENVIRWWNEN